MVMVGVGILDRSHTHAPMGPGMGRSGSSAGVDLVSSTWGKIKKGRPGGVGVAPPARRVKCRAGSFVELADWPSVGVR